MLRTSLFTRRQPDIDPTLVDGLGGSRYASKGMPELAASYLVGFIFCALLACLFLFLASRRRRSLPFRQLQCNLGKVGLFWSENQDKLISLSSDLLEQDYKSLLSNLTLLGFMLCFLSWAGLFFLFIIMLSYRFLARSRLERALFASELAHSNSLSADNVRALLEAMQLTQGKPTEGPSELL